MATLGMNASEKEAIDAFKRDVIDPSMTNLIILDFWAEWCGPCKALSPVLEKVAADYAGKGVRLAKINVDENRFVAAQFRVQSIPTVYAVFKGQLVADLTNYRSEGQLAKALDQILKQVPVEGEEQALAQEIEPLIAMGEEVLSEGDAARAMGIFGQLAEMAPDHPEVISGYARAMVAAGELDQADALLSDVSPELLQDANVQRAVSALSLARNAKPVSDLSALEQKVAAHPNDHEARLALANGMMGNGDRDGAADHLLAIIAADRDWHDQAARKQLIQLFEVVGLEDPWVAAQRRKLSAVLFT